MGGCTQSRLLPHSLKGTDVPPANTVDASGKASALPTGLASPADVTSSTEPPGATAAQTSTLMPAAAPAIAASATALAANGQPRGASRRCHHGRGSARLSAAASSRLSTSSFERICETWYFAPATVIPSRWAISSFVRPMRSRSRTSCSRRVSCSGDRRFHMMALSSLGTERHALVLSWVYLCEIRGQSQGVQRWPEDEAGQLRDGGEAAKPSAGPGRRCGGGRGGEGRGDPGWGG